MKPLLLALFLLFAFKANSITITWDGGGGDERWNTAANWNPDVVPGALDNVIINTGSPVNVNGEPAVMNNFDFTDPDPGARLWGLGSLTVNGTFNMLGNVGITGEVTINGTLNWDYTFQGGGTVNCNGTTNIGATLAAGVASNSSQIVKLNGGGNWINDLYINPGGHVQIPIGATLLHSGTNVVLNPPFSGGVGFEILGTLQKSTAGSISVVNQGLPMTNSGTISMEAGSSLTIESSFTNAGLLKGNGIYTMNSTFTQSGSISPDNSPGNAIGLLTLNKLPVGTANTFIEMQGTATPGVDYDQIAVAGAGVADGVLNLSFLGAFNPSVGDEFTIMTCNSCSGTFASISSPSVAPNTWELDMSNPNAVVLRLNAPLPIELVEFKATSNDHSSNLLTWRTASEEDNAGFHIERAHDVQLDWQDIGFVPGNGTTTSLQYYDFFDKKPAPGTNYYRLRQMDFDGKFEYSDIRSVMMEGSTAGVHIYPNPMQGGLLNLNFAAELEDAATLRLFDTHGNLLRQEVLANQHNQTNCGNLSAGIYFIEVTTGKGLWRERLMVQ